MFRSIYVAFGAAALLAASVADAADVKATRVHNCCPACAKVITSALQGAGAKNITVKTNELSFSADDPQKAVNALYDAGFAVDLEQVRKGALRGRIRQQGRLGDVDIPGIVGAKGVKGKEIKVAGVYNCCGTCATAINGALKNAGATLTVKPKETTFTVRFAKDTEAEDVVKALRGAGFNARVGQ